jgi:hypothetical protein
MVRPFGALFFGRPGSIGAHTFSSRCPGRLYVVSDLAHPGDDSALAGIISCSCVLWPGSAASTAASPTSRAPPHGKRGFFTSDPITATFGLFCFGRHPRHPNDRRRDAFNAWAGEFCLQTILSLLSRSTFGTRCVSPLRTAKKAGTLSKNPLVESFVNPFNLKWVALALFGATMGQGVVWYTGQFYALFYLQKVFGVPLVDANYIVGGALLLATPFFVFMGWFSDRIGRKRIMLTGMLAALLTYYPLYRDGCLAPLFPTDPAVLEKLAVTTQQLDRSLTRIQPVDAGSVHLHPGHLRTMATA